MIERGQQVDLAPLAVVGIVDIRARPEDLDRNVAADLAVAGPVHHRHAAPADHLAQFVPPAEQAARQRHRLGSSRLRCRRPADGLRRVCGITARAAEDLGRNPVGMWLADCHC